MEKDPLDSNLQKILKQVFQVRPSAEFKEALLKKTTSIIREKHKVQKPILVRLGQTERRKKMLFLTKIAAALLIGSGSFLVVYNTLQDDKQQPQQTPQKEPAKQEPTARPEVKPQKKERFLQIKVSNKPSESDQRDVKATTLFEQTKRTNLILAAFVKEITDDIITIRVDEVLKGNADNITFSTDDKVFNGCYMESLASRFKQDTYVAIFMNKVSKHICGKCQKEVGYDDVEECPCGTILHGEYRTPRCKEDKVDRHKGCGGKVEWKQLESEYRIQATRNVVQSQDLASQSNVIEKIKSYIKMNWFCTSCRKEVPDGEIVSDGHKGCHREGCDGWVKGYSVKTGWYKTECKGCGIISDDSPPEVKEKDEIDKFWKELERE